MDQDSDKEAQSYRRAFDTIRGFLSSVPDTHERAFLYRMLEQLYEAAVLTVPEKATSSRQTTESGDAYNAESGTGQSS